MAKIALVFGGTGNIGSATVRAFLEEGSCDKVVVTSRKQENINKFKSSLSDNDAAKIIGIVADPAQNGEAVKEKVVAAVGDKIDFAVSAIGIPWIQGGAFLENSKEVITDSFTTQCIAPFEACKAVMSLVKNAGGSYVFVCGGGPDMYLGPGTGVMTIIGSAAAAVARVVMKEYAASGICCTEVAFRVGIAQNPAVMPPNLTWLSSADAGRALVKVAQQKAAHVKTLVITKQEHMDKVIANGSLE